MPVAQQFGQFRQECLWERLAASVAANHDRMDITANRTDACEPAGG
jgi:hypothetical protein